MIKEYTDWRSFLQKRILNRDATESKNYRRVFKCNSRLIESVCQLEVGNMNLTIHRAINVRSGFKELGINVNKSAIESNTIRQTDLHGSLNIDSQLVSSLKGNLDEKTKTLLQKEQHLLEQISLSTTLKAENHMLKTSLEECTVINTTLRDEYTALQLALAGLESKLAQTQDQNKKLIETLTKYKPDDVEVIPEDNDCILERRFDTIQKALEDASIENRRSTTPVLSTRDCSNTSDLGTA